MKKIAALLCGLKQPNSYGEARNRKIALATITALASRASALLLTYFSVALAVGKMGPINFGLWMTVNSMSVLLPFADFGLGNGLVSYVSRRIGERRESLIPPAITACLYMTGIAGSVIAIGGIFVSHSGLLHLILRHQQPGAVLQIAPSVQIFFILLGLTLPASIVEKVQMGAQDGYLTNLWQIASNLATCLGLYLVATADCSLSKLVLVYSGVPVVVKSINSVSYFRNSRLLTPSLSQVDWETGRHLLKCGLSFVLLQSSVAIGYTCDNLILAAQSGAVAVATYDVVQRLFSLTIVAELSIAPLWGAFGEALSRGDVKWVRDSFYRSLKANGSLALIISLCLAAASPMLIRLWTHGRITAPWTLVTAFAVWRVFNIVQGNLSVLLNHESTLPKQTTYFASAAMFAFLLKFWFLSLFGMSGVVFATVLSFALIYAVPSFRMAEKLFLVPDQNVTKELTLA